MVPPLLYLVLIETAGNQRHIFSTNKLAENVGASEQLHRLGTRAVLTAVRESLEKRGVIRPLCHPADVLDDTKNPRLATRTSSAADAEVWYVSSGKALILVTCRELGRDIVAHVTRTALVEYPGVAVRGAIVELGQLELDQTTSVAPLDNGVKAVHGRVEQLRSHLLPPECRYQRLPIVAPCRNSGLPAAGFIEEGDDDIAVSQVAAGKRGGFEGTARKEWQEQIRQRFDEILPKNLSWTRDLDKLEAELETSRYIAVVHADGNGVGKIFENFHKYLPSGTTGRGFIDAVREFSAALDAVTQEAFRAAVDETAKSDRRFAFTTKAGEFRVPLLPLIVGGDDVTLLTTAQFAMVFVPEFLRQFEQQVAKTPQVAKIVQKAFGVQRLGMAAGIAIVKPHYPFYAAYTLCEGLTKATKTAIKTMLPVPVAAYDFHVHHSSSGDDLDAIRAEMRREFSPPSQLWGGPYVVTPEKELASLVDESRTWAKNHRHDELIAKVRLLSARSEEDSGRRALPNSQMHDLRSHLFDAPQATEAWFKLIEHRYPSLRKLQPLFRTEKDIGSQSALDTLQVTTLLDAMALAHLEVPTDVLDEKPEAETLTTTGARS